jgi:hypothetical protein
MILIGGQLAILYKYINSRKEIKKTWWANADKKEREKQLLKKQKIVFE